MLFWKTYPFGLYTVRKEIKKNGDFEILHETVLDTTRISSCFFVLCIVSRTILCRISESPLHLISLSNSVGPLMIKEPYHNVWVGVDSLPFLSIY